MNRKALSIAREYCGPLERYLAEPREALLEQAYRLGRKGISRGLGVMDIVRVHQLAMTPLLAQLSSAEESEKALRAAEVFLMEALSPFEAAHRGFREANVRLGQLNEELEERNAALRSLSNQVLTAQEDERKRISRELHDEVGQALTAVRLHLAVLQLNGAAGEARVLKEKVGHAQRALAQAMETVHDFARQLRPALLDDLGISAVLRSYLREYSEATGLKVRFTPGAGVERLNGEQKTALFRVAQESLTNVVKHARATEVVVTLRSQKSGILMRISDNGIGFALKKRRAAAAGQRLGLVGIEERVRLVAGRSSIRSAPGKGTTVEVEIPYPARNHRRTAEGTGVSTHNAPAKRRSAGA